MDYEKYFSLNRNTWTLYWNKRSRSDFKTDRDMKIWNTRYAGKEIKNKLTNKSGVTYTFARIKTKTIYAHRVIFAMVNGFEPDVVDHIDGNGENNNPINLRSVSTISNSMNQKVRTNSKIAIMGVYWFSLRNKWVSRITVKGKKIHLGLYEDFFEACCARKSAERKYGFHLNHGRRS